MNEVLKLLESLINNLEPSNILLTRQYLYDLLIQTRSELEGETETDPDFDDDDIPF